MRNKKWIYSVSGIAIALLLVFLAALPVKADDSFFVYDNPSTGYSIYMDDEEDLLTDAEEAALIEDMKPITEYGNAGFVSCQVYSQSTEDYAKERYAYLFGTDSGTLFVIDMGNRQLYIKNNGAVSKTITNAYSNTITDNIYRYASQGDYYTCASTAFSQIYTVLEGGRIAQPMRYITAALLALILGFLINFLILRVVTLPGEAGTEEIINAADVEFVLRNPESRFTNRSKVYSPVKRSGGGGGGSRGGGGGFSGGGGSGGGHGF